MSDGRKIEKEKINYSVNGREQIYVNGKRKGAALMESESRLSNYSKSGSERIFTLDSKLSTAVVETEIINFIKFSPLQKIQLSPSDCNHSQLLQIHLSTQQKIRET